MIIEENQIQFHMVLLIRQIFKISLCSVLLFFTLVKNSYSQKAIMLDSWAGVNHGDFIVGYAFDISQPITINALGKFDFSPNGLNEPSIVSIWNDTTEELIVSATMPSGSMGIFDKGAYYSPVTPTILLPGRYVIGTQTFLNGEIFVFNANINTGSEIDWVEGRYTYGSNLILPKSVRNDGGSYFGPNFIYTIIEEDNISVTNLSDRQIIQRNEQDKSFLPIEGTVKGRATLVEARAIPVVGFPGYATPWTLIDNTIDSGIFSGTLEVFSGWYCIELRGIHEDTQVAWTTIDHLGVGDVFITAGQSNSANYGSPMQYPEYDCISARMSVSLNEWQKATDPQPIATGNGGSPWPRLGDLLFELSCIPIGFVSLGVGSTRVDEWLPGTINYEHLLKEAIISLEEHGGFKAIIWHQGESDSIAATSSDNYAFRMQQIISQSRNDAGWDVPWGVALASYHPYSTATAQSDIIIGQQKVIANNVSVFQGAHTNDFHLLNFLHDSVHFNQEGLDEHAARWYWNIISEVEGFIKPGDFDKDGDVDGLDLVEYLLKQEILEFNTFTNNLRVPNFQWEIYSFFVI